MTGRRAVEPRHGPESSEDFLSTFRERLRRGLHHLGDLDEISQDPGLPASVWREIRGGDPYSAFIPRAYGGRGGHVHEGLDVLAAASYESLPLSVLLAINWTLFLQPVAKYGQEEVKAPTFDRFLHGDSMGGFMLTEPDFGSDALGIRTSYVETGGQYHIEGTKHWGGLTGWADFWLVAARERGEQCLKRDIDFFLCDTDRPGQHVTVEEMFPNLGLCLVPYGRNEIDARVPRSCRLQPEGTGISMMVDLLHHSRMKFPGMGMGFLRRLLDEALDHCKERQVSGASLFEYDQVQRRLARLQAAFTTCSAMCVYSSETAPREADLGRRGFEANAIKAVLTDLMQEASQSLLQLVGAKGFRLDHIAGRATVDSRPFQIFEGSNDILYHQITESVVKDMRREEESDLLRHLSSRDGTTRAADYFGDLLSFDLDHGMRQRKQVQLGRALGRIFSLQLVLELGDRGFRQDLIRSAVSVLREDVSTLLTGYREGHGEDVVDEYGEESAWRRFVDLAPEE